MCGIAGVLDPRWSGSADALADLAAKLAQAVSHRGPDDRGTWCDAEVGLGLGHQRLAIIDLSAAGHQPMVSADGRWVATYNGECYNAPELSRALPGGGRGRRGHCDTEVVLEAVAAWGLARTLAQINGMFALALWDRQERVLHLIRDRMGEKPLYYALAGGALIFGSELRALTAYPRFDREIDRTALSLLLRLSYIPAPSTIYASARKLAAGQMVTVAAGSPIVAWPEPETWWDFRRAAPEAMASRPEATRRGAGIDPDVLDRLDVLLRDSVQRRMAADVPIGTFLSGGIDSTLIAALAGESGAGPVRTFTVGFGDRRSEGLDESAHAAAVAGHLGTDHTQMDLTAADALAAVPHLHERWDEPFADPSQLPTLLLCREARRHVTVALSGDGGDEVFGGYRRYTAGAAVSRRVLPVPIGARRVGAHLLNAVPVRVWDEAGRIGRRVSPRRVPGDLGTKAQKLATTLGAGSVRDLYVGLVSAWPRPEDMVIGRPPEAWPGPPALGWVDDPAETMMAWDTLTTLPDEMLTKVDRASMSFGLEVRVPLLDHRVVEAAWALPPGLRIQGHTGKQALRQILDRYVPRSLVDRPKAGFDPPLNEWLRGPLRSWADDLLAADHLRRQGLLRPEPITARWQQLQQGRPGHDYALWAVLVFQSWLAGRSAG